MKMISSIQQAAAAAATARRARSPNKQTASCTHGSRVTFLSGGLEHLQVSTALVVQIFTASQKLDQCTLQFPAQEDQLGIITKQKRTQQTNTIKINLQPAEKICFFETKSLRKEGQEYQCTTITIFWEGQTRGERERERVVGIEQLPTKKNCLGRKQYKRDKNATTKACPFGKR